MISVVLAAMVIVVGGWWLWPRQDGGSTTIAVAAAAGDNAVRSRDFARSIANDLGRYRAGPAGAPTIIDGNSPAAGDADYRVEVGVSGNGPDLRAEVSLQPPGQGRLLWSSAVEGQGRPLVDLRQEVAASVGDVLRCLAELQASGKMPSQEVKALYLNGCAKQEASEEAISIFRQITRLAPKFGPGWAGLAALETWSVPTASEGDRPALLSAIREHLRQAEALAPDHPDTIAAKAAFRPGDAKRLPDALAVLDRGLQRHPESAVLHRMRAERLLDTGRMRDAVAEARRASELNPLSPAMRDTFISALAYSGQSEEAFQLLKKADSTWPGSALLRELRFRLDLRFGDPRDGLQSLAESGPSDTTSDPANQAWRSFLEARAEPTPARIESGLAVFRARYARDNGDVPGYLQALGTFGKIDDAYRATEPALAIESLYVSTHVLFRPYMRSFRADPRFILLSARLGLLQYWRKTGLWPDFCSDPRLPYDCAKEAAKLTPAQLVPAPSHQLTGTPRAAKR